MEQITNSNTPAMSEDVRALVSAFLLAQEEFTATGLDGDNSFQKYKYAKLGAIYKSVKKALATQGIVIWHFARPQDTGLEYLYTRLIHKITGQFVEDCRILESEKPGNQAKGSANTYMRKYAVLSLCGIAPDDEDCEDEEKHIANKPKQPELLVKDEVEYLTKQLESCGNSVKLYNNILRDYKVKSMYQIPFSCYETIKSYIANNKE